MKREAYKTVTIGKNEYRVETFDPIGGGKVFLFCLKKIVPLLKALDIDFAEVMKSEVGAGMAQIAEIVTPVLEGITGEDLAEFMGLCLERVEIKLPAGYEKVYRHGEFTDTEVRYSTKLALQLCYVAIEDMIVDFFGESSLTFLQGIKQSMSQQDA